MTEESKYLLKVLRSFVLNESIDSFNGDYQKLVNLSGIHSVTGILGYMIMNNHSETNMEVINFMKRQCLQTIALQTQRSQSMNRLINILNERQIDHLLFKGFIVKDYYPVPELRTYGDVDFLIKKEDRKKVDKLMMELGFSRETDWEPVYSYLKGNEYYEIHSDVMEIDVSNKADYKGYYQDVWNHTKSKSDYTYELIPEYHLLYLLTHIAKHISSSGAGIRMYLDIALFIKYFDDSLDYEYIKTELEKLAFTDFSNMVFTVVEKIFGIKSPIKLKEIDSSILDDFIDYTMSGGVFGHHGRDGGVIYLKNEDRDSQEISRFKTLRKRLFPSASSIESRYTYLQGKHYLLPLAWMHRLIKTRDKLEYHVKQAESILNTDEKEALKLRRIYKEIGL